MACSLGFAHLFQPIYEAAIRDCPHVIARAIMDDICFAGPPAEVFRAFSAFRALAVTRSTQAFVFLRSRMASAAGNIQSATLAPGIPVCSVSLDLNLRIDSSHPSHFIRLTPLVGPFRNQESGRCDCQPRPSERVFSAPPPMALTCDHHPALRLRPGIP